MKLMIDNLQGGGLADYTAALDRSVPPRIARTLNKPSKLQCTLVLDSLGLETPVSGARITLSKTTGDFAFTGYLTQAPQPEYLGTGERGPVYRYEVVAGSDEILLDQKVLGTRAPFVTRTAGAILRQLAQDLLPGLFDTSAVEDVDTIASYRLNPQKPFSFHASEIALEARGSYRTMNNVLFLSPIAASTHALNESDANFSPMGLSLVSQNLLANDVTVIGLNEPKVFVRDYFVGDGFSRQFYLSHQPFQQNRTALIDEQFLGATLDETTWMVTDPASAISVVAEAMNLSGGTGFDGQTKVQFVEHIELGGAVELQHGDVSFTGICRGVIGGLYAGSVSTPTCVAGFQITASGNNSIIQALINGTATGSVINVTPGHRYVFTTYLYSTEVYRSQQTFHSTLHPAGNGRGGQTVTADVRFVLDVQDIDPSATMVAPAVVLYDGVISNAPAFCTYALVNSTNMKCSIADTYVAHISLSEVRTALPDSSYVTQIVESLSDGGQCIIASSTSLDFYPQYIPPLNTLIVASYRGYGRAIAEVIDESNIASRRIGNDDGVRGIVRAIQAPSARTQEDCENAALALLDDSEAPAWAGSYQTWSDFLPGDATDVFPGDGLDVNVPSQNAEFNAVIRSVEIDLVDLPNDRGKYAIEFANELVAPLGVEGEERTTPIRVQDRPPRLSKDDVGGSYLSNLTMVQVTQVTSTSVQVDVGVSPDAGFGVEVRARDYNWGKTNDRNLFGRFSTQTFVLPRLTRTQNYFLRLYDSSSPPRYSRFSAALHVDYPL